MAVINITGHAATQNTGLHCSLLDDCIILPCCLLYFKFFSVYCKFCDFLPPGYDSIKSESEYESAKHYFVRYVAEMYASSICGEWTFARPQPLTVYGAL